MKKKRKKIRCKYCKEFFIPKYPYLAKIRKFCSRKCRIFFDKENIKMGTKECIRCEKTFEDLKYKIKRRKYCSQRCYWDGIKENRSGKNHHYYGKKLSKEHKAKMSESKKGKVSPRKGAKLSDETRKKLSISHMGLFVGNKSALWKGGITKLNFQIRNCLKYKQWRTAIFERDNYVCQECNQIGGKLNAAHYPVSFSSILKENNIKNYKQALNCKKLWDTNNGKTACVKCHKKLDRRGKCND
jgi:hypothetical protein